MASSTWSPGTTSSPRSPHAQRQQSRVFLNDGNSGGEPTFVDFTNAVGIEGLYTREPHAEIQDMDNDGYMDIVVSAVMTDPGQGGAQRPVERPLS